MKNFSQWLHDPDTNGKSMPKDLWRDAYESYMQRTVAALESAMEELRAESASPDAVAAAMRAVLAEALDGRSVDVRGKTALDVAKAAAEFIEDADAYDPPPFAVSRRLQLP